MKRSVCIVGLVLYFISAAAHSWAGAVQDAAAKGDLPRLTELVKQDPAVVSECDDADGATALHHAVAKSQLEIVRYLLKNGANVNARKRNGVTALHIAASSGSVEIVKMLLGASADAAAIDGSGRTPISIAQSKGYTAVVDILKATQAKSKPMPKADIVTTLAPLSIRGTNYYPSLRACTETALTRVRQRYGTPILPN